MNYLIYDKSYEGFLTAVFEVFEFKIKQIRIRKDIALIPALFTNHKVVVSNSEKANRVLKKITHLFNIDGANILWKAWLSEKEDVEDCLFGTIAYGIKAKVNILSDYGNEHVIKLTQLVKSVDREKHRMKAFVRFKLSDDGLFTSVIEPDFNVLPLIIKHFKNRYADQKWLIYDVKRNYGCYYNLKTIEMVEITHHNNNNNLPATFLNVLNEHEEEYQILWKNYFKSTNIQSRKNMKLHLQHVPKRYWKYLTEKNNN